MRAAVFGGNGFMGTHVVDRLLERGHSVTVFDQLPSRFRSPNDAVSYVYGSFDDGAAVRGTLRGIDVCFHLISATIPGTSVDDPVFDVRSNLIGTLEFLQACVDAGVGKVVFPSSGGTVYGVPVTIPISEDHPTEPLNPYGIVKLAIEKYLAVFRRQFGLDYAILRISNPYGPHQNPHGQQGAVSIFLERVRAGQPIEIWGNGSAVRDYVYVGDVADAFVTAASTATESRVLNIGSGRGTSLHDLIGMIGGVTGREPIVEYRAGRSLDVPVNVLSIELARKTLNWEPRTDLVEGIRRTWEWLQTFPPTGDAAKAR